MINGTTARFRKKFFLALGMFVWGSFLAFHQPWDAGSYTTFCALLLGIFGTADLVDKDKFRQMVHGQ